MLRGAQSKLRHNIPKVNFTDVMNAIELQQANFSSVEAFGHKMLTLLIYAVLLIFLLACLIMLIYLNIHNNEIERDIRRILSINSARVFGQYLIYLT